MKNKINKIYPVIFSISIIVIMLYLSFYIACFFDKNMLMKLWEKFDTIKNLPFKLSTEDLLKIQDELMLYLRGRIPFLETKVTINGILTDFYSIRTKVHMGDVRMLFKYSTYVCFTAIIFSIFSLFKTKNTKNSFKSIYKSYKYTILVFSLIFVALIIYAGSNFNSFFIKFHQIMFSNDYWLLDPREDFIICLLPEELFMDIGIKIVINILILLLSFGLLCRILSKIQQYLEAK